MKKTGLGFLRRMSAARWGAQTARIQEIHGTVEIKRPGASQWEAAQTGQVLDTAAFISTGFRSTALVTIGSSTLTVRALTRLSLEELMAAQNGERITVNLRAGRVRANVKPPDGGRTSFTVRSPVATASVRGTIFDFDGFRLRVEEGRVYFSGANGAGVYIREGHAAAADPETGKTTTVIEIVKEALSPAPPAGVHEAAGTAFGGGGAQASIPAPDPVPPPVQDSPPSGGNLDFEFDWNGL
jgi:hypothetical protein